MSAESNAGNAVLGLSSGAGIVTAVNEYATIISLSLTALGIIIGLLFHILAVMHRRKKDSEHLKQQEKEIKERVLRELERQNNQIKKAE